MYLSFYELNKKPFQTSSDPSFLWMGEKHKDALAMLKYGIMENRGFIKLTGDVGTGKTTLLNALKETLGPDVVTADILNPGLEKLDFLNFMAASFGLKETFRSEGGFLTGFREFLETCYLNGKQVLLIIDEAQRLTQEMLDEIRLLSNIERQAIKLLNIFLVGQDGLDDILHRHENRALQQLMAISYRLEPLTEHETGEFIAHRLKVAGAGYSIFTVDAAREVYFFSKGYPRLVNTICDYAMLAGYAADKKTIGADDIRESAGKLKLQQVKVPHSRPSQPPPAPEPEKTGEEPEESLQADCQRTQHKPTSIKKINFDYLIGRQVGTATLLKELSRGAMAVIFLAYQKTLKRQIAVKILPKTILTPMAAESFRQEAELASILSHPNIVPIYEIGDAGEFLFFTMQLVDGKPLSHRLDMARRHLLPSKRILPLQETLSIIIGVLDALEYAHGQDVIHRDIKPANILIEDRTGRPIITDFGVATRSCGPDAMSRSMAGTPIYMAPEQIRDGVVDGRADIYAAAMILFEMLVPQLPIPEAGTPKELLGLKWSLKDRFFQKRPSELNPDIDKEMDEIVLKGLSFYPERRYATCRAFLQDIEQYQARHMKNQFQARQEKNG
jgi:type II secretory pathway predicted ATPase ExeA/predicted Ser/Thr protein kinase